MSQLFRYPSSSASVTISAIGTNGLPAPATSIQVAGQDGSGDLQPLLVNGSQELLVAVSALPLPAGAATLAEQQAQTALLTTIDADTGSIDAKTPALVSGRVPVDVGVSVLPTGAATEATLAAIADSVGISWAAAPLSSIGIAGQDGANNLVPLLTDANGVLSVFLDSYNAISVTSPQLPPALGTQTVANSLSVTCVNGVLNPVTVDINSNSTDFATETTTASILGAVNSIDGKVPAQGQAAMAASMPVVIANNQTAVPVTVNGQAPALLGRSLVDSVRNDYSGTPVTTAAWVELIASIVGDVNEIFVFDSSGQTLELGVGPAASEVRVSLIVPGGNGTIPLAIASGSRLSIKAVSANASVGEIDLNLYS